MSEKIVKALCQVRETFHCGSDRWLACNDAANEIATLRSDLAALAARLAEGEMVIAPFAEVLKGNYQKQGSGAPIVAGLSKFDLRWTLKLGNFRAARSFLTPTGEGK